MTSGERTQWLRTLSASGAWMLPGLLIVGFVLLASFRSASPVAEAHGTVDQQQLIATTSIACPTGGCGQTFTPTANNIVAFDVNISPQSTAFSGMFLVRQWPAGSVLAGPFPVTLVVGVNHVEIQPPGSVITLTPGTKYEIQETTGGPRFLMAGDLYAGGALTAGSPVRTEVDTNDLYFATYFLPATATPTQTTTVTRTVTTTVTPTVTPTATATVTPTRVPTFRPNMGAFLEGASGTERNLQRAGIPDPRNPVQPVPAQAQVGGTTSSPGDSSVPAGVLRPPSTGDAGLVLD